MPAKRPGNIAVYQIDPLRDPRWSRLVESHPASSVFHTQAWLEALRRTYNYEPVVLTTPRNGEPLENGFVLCKVSSWLTGNRLVSLPFSDHCQPLVNDSCRAGLLSEDSRRAGPRPADTSTRNSGRSLPSIRKTETAAMFRSTARFAFTCWTCAPGRGAPQCFHKNHIQRKISLPQKEELKIEAGRSAKLLDDFSASC